MNQDEIEENDKKILNQYRNIAREILKISRENEIKDKKHERNGEEK